MLRIAFLCIAAALVLASPFLQNTLLVAASGVTLATISGLLLIPGLPPVLAFALGYQWAQVSTAALYASWLGIDLGFIYPVGDADTATLYGLLALNAAAIGAAALLRHFRLDEAALVADMNALSVSWVARAYGILLLVTLPLSSWAGVGGQFSQVVDGIAGLRWAAFFLLICCALVQRRGTWMAAAAVLFEVALGTSGFFAGFSIPLFFALMAFAATFGALARHQKVLAILVALVMLAGGMIWNTVKTEYRREISGFTGQQVIVVGVGEQYATLSKMTQESLSGDFDDAVEKFALRLAYVEYFGYVLDRVPAELPYRGGEQLLAAIEHVTVPRILYPDKAPLPSDSELTAFYTANPFLLMRTGTSISLGYVTELYIDFGVFGLPVAGLLIALLIGGVSLAFRRYVASPAIGVALTCAVLLNARLFETSLPKLLGGILASFIVAIGTYLLVQRWVKAYGLRTAVQA